MNSVEIRTENGIERIWFANSDSVLAIRITDRTIKMLPDDVYIAFCKRVVSALNATQTKKDFYEIKASVKELQKTCGHLRRTGQASTAIRMFDEFLA